MKKGKKEVSDKITNINHSKNENFKKYEEKVKMINISKEKDKDREKDLNRNKNISKERDKDKKLKEGSNTNHALNKHNTNNNHTNKILNEKKNDKYELFKNVSKEKTNSYKTDSKYSNLYNDMNRLVLEAENEKILKNSNCSAINQFYYKESQNIRPYMEDFCLIIDKFDNNPEKGFFLLLDGHGGSQVAQYVKDNLSEVFKKMCRSNVFQNAISETFSSIDSSLIEFNFSYDMGSTCSVIYTTKEFDITNGEKCVIHSANIGDSRSVLVNDNKVTTVNNDYPSI